MPGLTNAEAKVLLNRDGFNEIAEKNNNLAFKFFRKFFSPISFMLLAAAFLSFFVEKIFDFYFILVLLFLNILISLWQERKADDAIKKLNENLSQKVWVLRDAVWNKVDSRFVVFGDLVKLSMGEVVPADGKLLEAKHLSINESVLTGESLPKEKEVGDLVYSGSFLVTGLAKIKVTATGKETNFGKTIFSVERLSKKSLLEKDIIDISKFLTVLSLVAISILSLVFLLKRVSVLELLTLDLSILIASIPISLPTVMTLIIEFGVLVLAKKKAVVRRLSALEDLANVNFLLTDKTGTLTKNKIEVQETFVYGSHTVKEAFLYALLVAVQNEGDAIDAALINKAKETGVKTSNFTVVDYNPADSVRKRSTILVKQNENKFSVVLGAPQVILAFCKVEKRIKETFTQQVEILAAHGYRSLAVAVGKDESEKDMDLIGLFALSDTLRKDAKSVIEFLKENEIGVAMVTGDNRAIASEISHQLSLNEGKVVTKTDLDALNWESQINREFFTKTGAFAEVLPEDKLKLVEKAKEFFVVASNGDGVNDLPALKAANVGFAVKNAVSALKATADIVLLTDGISVISDSIVEGRKIFSRLYTYSLYRISESLRLVVTITVLGVLYRVYPLTALQIIVIALLNDIPIISLAFDRVKITKRPAKINAKKRFTLSSLYGLVGIANSLTLFFIMSSLLHLPWEVVQTMYFLKLTVSGHMLIYVAHTKERWFKFLPGKGVIWATSLTQLTATVLALTGFLMASKISLVAVVFVWIWSFVWMQVADIMKNSRLGKNYV